MNLTAFAMKRIIRMLREDPKYRQGWLRNISMAIYDELCQWESVGRSPEAERISFANMAADRFLRQLLKGLQ